MADSEQDKNKKPLYSVFFNNPLTNKSNNNKEPFVSSEITDKKPEEPNTDEIKAEPENNIFIKTDTEEKIESTLEQEITNNQEQDTSSSLPSVVKTEVGFSEKPNSSELETLTPEEVAEKLKYREKISSDQLKNAYSYILKLFGKVVSEEALFANSTSDDGIVKIDNIVQAAKRSGLMCEFQRVSLNNVSHYPALIILKDGHYVVLKDKTTTYNPDTLKEYPTEDLVATYHNLYIGYLVTFDEEDLTISSFFKKSNLLFNNIYDMIPHFIEMSVLGLLINVLGIILPFYTMNVYDRVIPNNSFNSLFVLTVGVLIGYVFELVFRIIRSYISDLVSMDVGKHVDNTLMERLLTTRPPGIQMTAGARQNLFREAYIVREFYFGRFIPAIIDIPYLLLFAVVLFIISPVVLLVPIVGSIVIFVFNIFFQVPLQRAHEKLMMNEQGKTSFLAETMVGIETLKIFNGVGKRLFKWNRVVDGAAETALTNSVWIQVAASFSNMVMQMVSVFVIVAGVFAIAQNQMSIGALIACTTLSGRVMTPIIAFAGMVVRYRSIQGTLRNLNKVVNYPSEDTTEDGASPSKKGPFLGRLTFIDVDFFYAGQRNTILHKCSFDIKPKEKVAIIGRTGVGKSTITRLLMGLDFPNSGRVLIDGNDIHGIHPSELRKYIGYFPQRSQFFAGTIRDNIILTGLDVTEERYKYACDFAGVHEIVTERSGRGDDMLISEGGTNISGGQQQVLAFARTILHDPTILIMDEPTNGMDVNLEAQFMQKVKQYIEDKTFVLITHKAQQLVLVDRVILIDKGRIVVDDTRDKVLELLSKGAK